jgi:hypothetical protein
MRRIFLVLLSVIALLSASARLFAHHGSAAFDMEHGVTLKGTVTELLLLNPHVQLHFDVKNDKGQVESWQAELTAPQRLKRAGWTKDTLKPGDTITVTGAPAKDGKHTLWIQKVIGPDGEPMNLGAGE